MTLTKVSILLAAIGVAAVIAGVVLLAGPAWALITGGVLSAVTAVVLYDPDVKRQR